MNLGTRLFLLFALLIVVSVGTAIGVTHWLSRNALDAAVNETLTNSQSVQRYFQAREQRELELISELVASDRSFVAYVSRALSSGSGVDTRSIADLLNERSNEHGFEFSLLLDPQGRTMVQTGGVIADTRNLSERAVVASVVESLTAASGLWIEDGNVLQVAAVPLISGRTVQGFILTGKQVSDTFISNIARVSQTDLAYVHVDRNAPSVAATTLGIGDSEALIAELKAAPRLLERVGGGQTVQRAGLDLAGQRWLARLTPTGDRDQAVLVSLVPESRLLRTFDTITNALLIAGIGAILIASLLSIGASRRFLKPIEELTALATDATRGEYPQQIDTAGSGEIGRLKSAFNTLVADLREYRAIESLFAELWQDRPDEQGTAGGAESRNDDSEAYAVGTVIGDRYEVLRFVGEGGMGLVYQARDRELNEIVALKMLKPHMAGDASGVDRLKDEIRLARRITHPNVVRIFDFGQADGSPFVSMEFVRGRTLDALIASMGRIEYYACLRLAREICAGLAAAHRAGVLHKDMKASNVMINYSAKVMDFGIARPAVTRLDARQDEQPFEGTPMYLAPEQINGDPADVRSDIYALGVLLTQMFTGNLPFPDDSTREVMLAHVDKAPIEPAAYWPGIPGALNALILKCLAKRPADRYQTVEEVRDELGRIRLQ